jgi:hypothetical protein
MYLDFSDRAGSVALAEALVTARPVVTPLSVLIKFRRECLLDFMIS